MSKSKRQRLGQHFLKSKNIAKLIVDAAQITKKDTVLEVGTGHGILTPLLCHRAKRVISVEADRTLYSDALSEFSGIENLELVCGDGFETDAKFSVFISNLPYSESKKAVEWLATKEFTRGVIMVQKEFADKILADGGKARRAVSVIANHALVIEKVMNVGKNNFGPPPKVDSVVLRIKKKDTLSEDVIRSVNDIFSYRRKTIANIAKKFGKDIGSNERLDDLDGDEIIKIAKKLI